MRVNATQSIWSANNRRSRFQRSRLLCALQTRRVDSEPSPAPSTEPLAQTGNPLTVTMGGILQIHSWVPHGALNGSNGWTHNLEVRELANDATICGLQQAVLHREHHGMQGWPKRH